MQINGCNVATKQFFTLTLSGATNAIIAQATTQVDVVGDNNLQATPGLYVRRRRGGHQRRHGPGPGPPRWSQRSHLGQHRLGELHHGQRFGRRRHGLQHHQRNLDLRAGPDGAEHHGPDHRPDQRRRFPELLGDAVQPVNAVITQGTGVVTIGASGGTAVSSPYIFAPPNTVAGEADGWMDLPVTLSAPSANLVTVAYSVPGGSCNSPDRDVGHAQLPARRCPPGHPGADQRLQFAAGTTSP